MTRCNRAGADLAKGDKAKNTALHIASRSGFGQLVTLLLDLGAPMKVSNSAGKLPADVALDDSVAALFAAPL